MLALEVEGLVRHDPAAQVRQECEERDGGIFEEQEGVRLGVRGGDRYALDKAADVGLVKKLLEGVHLSSVAYSDVGE